MIKDNKKLNTKMILFKKCSVFFVLIAIFLASIFTNQIVQINDLKELNISNKSFSLEKSNYSAEISSRLFGIKINANKR